MPLTIGPGVTISGGLTFLDEASAPPPAASYQMWTWGSNGSGMNGQNDNYPEVNARSSPVQVGSLDVWTVTKGNNNTQAAIRSNGTLWTWGSFASGLLGQNDQVYRSSPTQVGEDTNWSTLADGQSAGAFFALKTNGTLWGWGAGNGGVGGWGDTLNRSSPVQIGSGTDWAYVWGGQHQAMAAKTDGSIYVWGQNFAGQLGLNDTVNRSSPVQLTLPNWSKISVGQSHIQVVKTDGTLWSWGGNQGARLGQNDTVYRSSPTQVGTDTNWATPFAGQFNGACIKTNGTAWVWGSNGHGRLGLNDTVDRSSPTQLGADTDWYKVIIYGSHAIATKTNYTAWTWGRNFNGMLGDDTATGSRSSPVQLGAAANWADVRINGTTSITTLRSA